MSSTFGGITQAASALDAASYGLGIVSDNIQNADTDGYTRQEVQFGEVGNPGNVPTLYATPSNQTGVQVLGVNRTNDPVIDARARTEEARSGTADTTASQLSSVEAIFPEPSDTGLSEQLSKFWNDWSAVANSPTNSAARTVLIQQGETVAGQLNAMGTSLQDVVTSTQQSLSDGVDSLNSLASQLANLNQHIAVANATGTSHNDLLDTRDTLLDKIANLSGGVASIQPDGTANVTVDSQPLVSGQTANTVTVAADFSSVSIGGTVVTLDAGSMAANENALTNTYPSYQNALDSVAAALTSTVNSIQTGGYDANGNPGQAMFSGSTAATISVAFTDPDLVAAASTAGSQADGSNALSASQSGTLASSPDNAYTKLVGQVGADSALAQQAQTTQDSVTSSVTTQRQSASGVNYDEEVSNMLTLERSYQASSRVLTTMDSLLDTLINHTGLVG